ncbi:hypothetical protein [Halobellus marinus]|jgi:hypothetical protein|uniref:hypothetical protein n=1 Tax=Halobellus TaxID=1073986 RepID=UPI0028AB02B7|nr:hypothetical protein [Halobellus sp. DFY28]
MRVPDDAPELCPVCETAYDSISEHEAGIAVNLLDNERYRRVCFEPLLVDGSPRLRFYHHTHEQVAVGKSGDRPPTADSPTTGTESVLNGGDV